METGFQTWTKQENPIVNGTMKFTRIMQTYLIDSDRTALAMTTLMLYVPVSTLNVFTVTWHYRASGQRTNITAHNGANLVHQPTNPVHWNNLITAFQAIHSQNTRKCETARTLCSWHCRFILSRTHDCNIKTENTLTLYSIVNYNNYSFFNFVVYSELIVEKWK